MTVVLAARHRVGQVAAVLFARLRPPDDAVALAVLPRKLAEAYSRMAPEDKRHGLDVYRRLEAQGCSDLLLLQTALLHDVGKCGGGIGIGHRIARVLLASRGRRAWSWLSRSSEGWRRPFWYLAHHPERGADLVRELGACPEMVELIRYHESSAPSEWSGSAQAGRHSALAAVDAVC